MDMEQEVGRLYRQHSPRVLATLIRLTGDFDLAEEAMQEAFATAMQQWPGEGVPEHPVAWLVRVGQRRNIDQIRRHQVARRHARQQAPLEDEALPLGLDALDAVTIQDDMLRLLFTCCHPALAMVDRVALTLREMCGLTTEQVAAALGPGAHRPGPGLPGPGARAHPHRPLHPAGLHRRGARRGAPGGGHRLVAHRAALRG
ncbi:sigma factor, partial [Halomonas campaniensis]|uniref:sigma factor n=1 Tax=Halomonas campaniensis TaxID=213554 RepID=UPI003566B826